MALDHNDEPRTARSVAVDAVARIKRLAAAGVRRAESAGHLVRPMYGYARTAERHFTVRVGRLWQWMQPWMERQPIWRFCTKSIWHRIFAANLVGFVVLIAGLIGLSQANRWLVDAKVDSLTTQARMIAIAIADNTKMASSSWARSSDPDQSEDNSAAANPFRIDDTFAEMRLAIAPERIAPILNRLIRAGDVRARIYGSDKFLIIDSDQRLTRGQVPRIPGPTRAATQASQEPIITWWTRFMAWVTRAELPVYRDVAAVNAAVYPEIEKALSGDVTRMLLINADSEQMVAVGAPITHLDRVLGVVHLSSRPGAIDDILAKQARALIVLSTLAFLATLFASWLLGRSIAVPMRRLSAAAEAVSHNMNARRELPDFPGRRDEVAAMAEAFRDMTASLFRRIEASDRFAQDVAHELKNPVAAARSTAESLRYAKSEEQRAALVGQIEGEMKRLNRLITDVAKASRLDAELALQETEPIDISEIATGIVGVLGDLHRDDDRHIVIKLPPTPVTATAYVVIGHEGRLGQVLTNLIDNAVSFSPPGGIVAVRLERAGDKVVIRVDDDGPGIPPDRLEHVFKRFYSDRPQSDRLRGKNSGLGLSISREIVIAHGGTVSAENRPAEPGVPVGVNENPELHERRIPGVAGARFTVILPAADSGRRA